MKILNFFKGFTNSKQQKANTFDADDAPRIYRNVERPYFTPDAISELRNDEIFVFVISRGFMVAEQRLLLQISLVLWLERAWVCKDKVMLYLRWKALWSK